VGIGSIATLGAVVVALWAIVVDRRARSAGERMEQARQISAWISRFEISMPPNESGDGQTGFTIADLLNSSDQPVYRLIAWLVTYPGGMATGEEAARRRGESEEQLAAYGVVPPGMYELELPEFVFGMLNKPAVEISFTDAAGRHWIRRQDGRLVEMKRPPVEHYGLLEPLDWLQPRPVR
jgi:hypothetical protein